jgi:hypothetical protein
VQLRLKLRYSLLLGCFMQKTAICRHYSQLITHSLTHKPSLSYNADPMNMSHKCALQSNDSAVSLIRTTRYPTWAAMLLDAHWYAGTNWSDIYTALSPVRDWEIKLVQAEQTEDNDGGTFTRPPWRGTFNHLVCACGMWRGCSRRSRNSAAIGGQIVNCGVQRSKYWLKDFCCRDMRDKFWCNGNEAKCVVCLLLGNYPASEFYMPTFRNNPYVPTSQAGRCV